MKNLFEYAEGLESGIKHHGNHPEGNTRLLRAGGLSMLYENGALRYVRDDSQEIIRMIYFAVRDSNWLTILPSILNEEIEIYESSFIIRYSAKYEHEEIGFNVSFIIEGRQDSSIILRAEGEAVTTFLRNRIGFCVLHPIENCAGKTCVITHSDESKETTSFPEAVSPHQPFMDICSMSWPVNKGKCFLYFSGDIFETEDQRNWTDASFKTYSTPLSIPYPVTVTTGTTVSQSVEFRLEKTSFKPVPKKESVKITISSEEDLITLPFIGIARSSRIEPLTSSETRILRSLHPDHYRVDLHLFDNSWRSGADQAVNESSGLNCSLELALFFDNNFKDQITTFKKWVEEKRPEVKVIHLFHGNKPVTPDDLARDVIPKLRKLFPEVRIGTGTNANFLQLNRFRPVDQDANLVTWSIHPQEHASDNRTLVENLSAQGETVRSAMLFSEDKGKWVSPVNIQRRFNSNKLFYETPYTGEGIPPQVDSRQMSLLGACWTAGSLKYLLEADVQGITYYETVGERGIIHGEFESKWPEKFPSARGMVFPVFFVFKFLTRNKGHKVLKSVSSAPLSVDSLVLSDGKQVLLTLINFTGEAQKVLVTGCTGMFRIKSLSEKSYASAVSNYLWTCEGDERTINSGKQLELEPWSITFMEGWLKH